VIIDSSVVMAIVLQEPDGRKCLKAILDEPTWRMSVANWLEATTVVDRRGKPV
jgi:ribonuclease VapC